MDATVPPVSPYRYCWSCAHPLDEPPPTYCRYCRQRHFLNPKPCGEAVVIEQGRVLLLRRARDPWRGAWDVPGGFCEGGEHPMRAAERELAEELGIEAEAAAYVGTWIDAYGPPALDGVQEHTVNCSYLMRSRQPLGNLRLQADEVLEARWFAFDELPSPLAFPDHMGAMLRAAVRKYEGSAEPLPDRSW